jgi:hypothetical protein
MPWFALLLSFIPISFCLQILILGLCFAIVYTGKKVFRVGREDINNKKGSLVSLVFAVWGVGIAAWVVAFFVSFLLFAVTTIQETIIGLDSAGNLYAASAIFAAMFTVFYTASLTPEYPIFKGRIRDKRKAKGMFFIYLTVSSVIGFFTYLLLIPTLR